MAELYQQQASSTVTSRPGYIKHTQLWHALWVTAIIHNPRSHFSERRYLFHVTWPFCPYKIMISGFAIPAEFLWMFSIQHISSFKDTVTTHLYANLGQKQLWNVVSQIVSGRIVRNCDLGLEISGCIQCGLCWRSLAWLIKTLWHTRLAYDLSLWNTVECTFIFAGYRILWLGVIAWLPDFSLSSISSHFENCILGDNRCLIWSVSHCNESKVSQWT